MNKNDATMNEKTIKMFQSLCQWIKDNGGFVHESLYLKETNENNNSDEKHKDDGNPDQRGIFAKDFIANGQLLISLPLDITLHGANMPKAYRVKQTKPTSSENDRSTETTTAASRKENQSTDVIFDTDDSRRASNWLCTLGALYAKQQQQEERIKRPHTPDKNVISFQPYLASLPLHMDTILSWSSTQVETFLGGTTLGKMVLENNNGQVLERQFGTSVLPYLQQHNLTRTTRTHHRDGNDDKQKETEFMTFCRNSMYLSTRGFSLRDDTIAAMDPHHQPQQKENIASAMTPLPSSSSSTMFPGPYLLPLIDLINHADGGTYTAAPHDDNDNANAGIKNHYERCTTLQFCPKRQHFYMMAERNIEAGQEILHSYAHVATSAQLLQTFGFVTWQRMQLACSTRTSLSSSFDDCLTPAMVSKQSIIDACHHVMTTFSPDSLNGILSREDETWDVPSLLHAKRNISHVAQDEFVITQENPLSDPIVTLCCLLFLPDEAYLELVGSDNDTEGNNKSCTLVDKSILDDVFLGYLVCTALLRVCRDARKRYQPISLHKHFGEILGLERLKRNGDNDTATTSLSRQHDETDEDATHLGLILNELSSSEDRSATSNMKTPGDVYSTKKKQMLCHAAYGLTIRLEEKKCLDALFDEIMEFLEPLQPSSLPLKMATTRTNNSQQETTKEQQLPPNKRFKYK